MMNLIHESSTHVEDRDGSRGYTDTEKLTDFGGHVSYTHDRLMNPRKGYGNYREVAEFELTDEGDGFSVYLDPDSDDRDSHSACVTIPRERMFEIHGWLTEKLYGVDTEAETV